MRLNALWWWIDRWRKSTAYTDMTVEEQGAYRNLLDEATLRGGPLPEDERILARACGDPRIWKRVRRQVMSHFHLTPAGWRNDTLDEVMKQSERRIANQQRYRDRRSQPDNKPDNAAITNPITPRSSAGHKPDNEPAYLDPDPNTKNDDVVVPPRRVSGLGRGLLKPHGNVAFDSPRAWVPWKLHLELVGLRNNPQAEDELQAFYQRVSDEWTLGIHADDNVDPEMFNFWRARYVEHWPPAKAEKPRVKTADELQMDANKAKYVPPSRRLQ